MPLMLPDACLQFGHHFNPMGDSDDDDEDDEHLDHDAITLPGAGLQLGDHLDQVGVLLEESPQPERDVRRVHLVMMVISVLVVIMIMVMVMTTCFCAHLALTGGRDSLSRQCVRAAWEALSLDKVPNLSGKRLQSFPKIINPALI